MDTMHKMTDFIVRVSIGLGLVAAIIGWIVFNWNVALGIVVGLAMGLLGYRSIVNLTETISVEEGENQGKRGYFARYSMYCVILVACAFLHLSILGVLVGFMIHKMSLLIYVIMDKGES